MIWFVDSDLKSSLASWSYDANDQLLQVRNATATNVISQYDYIYDGAGRRINCAHSGAAFDQQDRIDYAYNARGELTNAVSSVDSAYGYTYVYDDIGNREAASEQGADTVYASNPLNQNTNIVE